MQQITCPACGGEVKFQSGASVFAVCPYCNSTLYRDDLKVENLGMMAVLPEDSSPLQIGTVGKAREGSFTIIGRIRQTWERGFWDEWFLYFDGERYGWLAEAQGMYLLSFETTVSTPLPDPDRLKPGNMVLISNLKYEVYDIKHAQCTFSQGELPFAAPMGRPTTTVDLGTPEGAFASIVYEPGSVGENKLSTTCFVGRYHEYDDLSFDLVREFDGW